MKNYYTRKSDGAQFVRYNEISNGQILTKFDEKTGTPIVNGGYQLFVTEEQLKTEFTAFEFKLEAGDQIDSIIIKHMSDFMYQFRNYGLLENQAQAFEELRNASHTHVYREMIKNEKLEYTDVISSDDEYEFGDAEDLFNMVTGGFIPIMKKMLIEYGESLK